MAEMMMKDLPETAVRKVPAGKGAKAAKRAPARRRIAGESVPVVKGNGVGASE